MVKLRGPFYFIITVLSCIHLLPGMIMFKQNQFTLDFEWAEFVESNKSMVNFAKIVAYKYNRTTTCTNITVSLKQDLNNIMKIEIQAYKFASNEYRLFPMRFAFNFCDFAARNEFGLADVFRCGNLSCPIKKGTHFACKWKPDGHKFPPNIPQGRYMHDIKLFYHDAMMVFFKGYGTVKYPVV